MKRPFGRGRPVSLFTLGTMRALESVDQMIPILAAAAEAGINHLETAPAYGPAEQFLGQAIERCRHKPADGWVITNKLLPDSPSPRVSDTFAGSSTGFRGIASIISRFTASTGRNT